MPTVPPNTDSSAASMRNCSITSRRLAPTALRMPISRVRSVTLTSMMFMMPMPPTSRAMDTIPPATEVMMPVMLPMMEANCLGLKTLKPSCSLGLRPLMRRRASPTRSAPSSALILGSMRTWKNSWRRCWSVSRASPVVRGMITLLSGSLPRVVPRSSRTPMISRLRVGVCMSLPMGLPRISSFSRTLGPMMATLFPRRRSLATKFRPIWRATSFSSR